MALPPNVDYSGKEKLFRARRRGPFKGLDTTSGLMDMDSNALRVARNVNLEDNGTISTRKGFIELLENEWTDYRIVQGMVLETLSSQLNIVAGRKNSTDTGALGLVASDYSGVTDIATGLDNSRPSLVQMNGLAFYYNGVDDFLYDGTGGSNPDEVRQIGITPPSSAPSLASNTDGSLVAGGSYQVAYTYYNANTGEESSPSPVSDYLTIAADPNDGITVTYTDGDANTATHVNFYRTFAGQPILFFDKSVAIGSTSTTLTQADAGLGRQLELDHTTPGTYGLFPYAWAAENRVYLTGRAAKRNRVQISAVTSTGPHPEAFPAKNFVDCESILGWEDYNLGGGMAGSNVIVLKTKSVGRIEKLGVDDTQLADDPVIHGYREISRACTAVSQFAAGNVFTEYVWLGQDNIYATDGVNVRAIADKIRQDLLDFNLQINDNYSFINDKFNKRITISISTSNSEPDYVLVGKYRNYPEFEWTFYTPGDTPEESPGISAGCFYAPPDLDNNASIAFGNTSYDGQIYQMNTGGTDNGDPIAWKVRFAPETFGFDEEEKLYIKDIVTMVGGNEDTTVQASSLYNSDESTEEEVQGTVLVGAGVEVWGGGNWGETTWARLVGIVTRVPHFCHKKAFSKQLQISSNSAETPVTLLNYQTMARPTAWRG